MAAPVDLGTIRGTGKNLNPGTQNGIGQNTKIKQQWKFLNY